MKTESNVKPDVYRVEALPPLEGRPCTVILADNITGPLTRDNGDGTESTYYTYDRYTIETTYRAGLEADVAADPATWIAQAKAAKEAGKTPTETEILSAEVQALSEQVSEQSDSIDSLTLAVLGG